MGASHNLSPQKYDMKSDIDDEIKKLRNELESVGIEVSLERLREIMYNYPINENGTCVDCGHDSETALCWSCFLRRLRA